MIDMFQKSVGNSSKNNPERKEKIAMFTWWKRWIFDESDGYLTIGKKLSKYFSKNSSKKKAKIGMVV